MDMQDATKIKLYKRKWKKKTNIICDWI